MKKCECGCGQDIIEKPHHKYEGLPRFLPGHQNRGKKVKRKKIVESNPQDRKKKYQNGFWVGEQIKKRWISTDKLAKECGVHAHTLQRYMSEVGITLNNLAEEKARALEDEKDLYIIFFPGTKNQTKTIEAECTLLEGKSYGSLVFDAKNEDTQIYYPIVRKVFVEGVGLGYLSKNYNPVVAKANVRLKKMGSKYKVELIKPTTVKAYKSIKMDQQEYILKLKEHFGNVEVVWI